MSENKTQVASAMLTRKTNEWERQQKARFAQMCQGDKHTYAEVIKFVKDEDRQNHRLAKINYRIQCFRNDGIFQLNKAITEVFGQSVSVDEKIPSTDKSEAIETVDIILADGTRCKAPYGKIALEELGEDSEININYDMSSHELIVTGKCQVRYQSMMDDVIEQTKWYLANESIYKGQALEISDINDPKILRLDGIERMLMVLSDKTKYDLRPIYARINNPELCIERGVPLKFGAIMEGPYGCGKTLCAFKLAYQAVSNGWIFIYLKDPSLLAEAIRMSKTIDHSGHGAVIFCEDIDQVTRGNRDAAMQDILNTLDGGDTKDMNVISLFTTNHIELIEPTFLRGKRIGTIISMGSLDAKTADEFIRESFKNGGYVIEDDLTDVCQYIEKSNIVPAFMAEIVEKVKAMMILDNSNVVKASEIHYAVESYLHQVELSKKKDMSETPEKRFVNAMKECLSNDSEKKIDVVTKMIAEQWEVNPADFK